MSLVDVTVRPWRYALAVRAGSADDVRRATSLAAESWGGVGWPLLPVDGAGEPDATALAVATAVGVDAVLDLRATDLPVVDVPWPVLPAGDLGASGCPAGGGRCVPPEPAGTRVALPGTGRIADTVAAGFLADACGRSFWLASGVRVREEDDPVALALAQITGRTAVVAGRHVAAATATGGPGTVGLVWVTDDPVGGVDDAVGFWNARALRGRGGVAGICLLADPGILAAPAVRELLPDAVRASSCGEPACVVLGTSVAPDRLAALARDLGTAAYGPGHAHRVVSGVDPLTLWGGEVPSPAVAVVAVREGDRLDLRVPAPVTVHPGLVGLGEAVLCISPEVAAGPRRPGVARLAHPSGRWATDGLRIPVTPASRYDVGLALPPPSVVLAAALRDRGVEVVSGDTGQLVDRLVGTLADRSLLRRPELQALLGALAALGGVPGDPVPLTGLAAATPVPAPDSGIHDVDSAGLAAVIDLLCGDGLVERGFRVDCGRCGMSAYPGFGSLTDGAPRCPSCGADSSYARSDSGEPAFHYRVHPLLRRLSYGPLPTVLATAAALLAEGAHISAYPQVRTPRDWERLDALGWHGDSLFGLVAVHAGSSAPEVAVARCAAAGVDVVVVAAVGALSDEQVAVYAETADRHDLMLSVLDARDLILPALTLPRKRSARRALPSAGSTLVIDLDGLHPVPVEAGEGGRLGG